MMSRGKKLSISLSTKIALMFTLLTVIIVLFFSLLTVTLIRASLLSQKEENVQSVYANIQAAFNVPYPITKQSAAWLINKADVPFYILYTLFTEDGSILLTNDPFIPRLPLTVQEKPLRYQEKNFYTDGDLDIIYVSGKLPEQREQNGSLYLQVSLDMAQDTTDSFLGKLPPVFLFCAVPLLLVSWVASKLTSARLLKPIRSVIGAAKNIEADKLDQRLPVPGADDELKELSTVFNAMFSRLEEDFIMQKRFTSDVSHELKTPLSVIMGYTDILRRWGKSDPIILDKAIEAIHTESLSMKKLIEDLQLLSQTDRESPQILYLKEPVILKDLLERIRRDTLLLSPDIQFELFCSAHIQIQANTDALMQVLRIIVNNSIAYSPPPAHITIEASQSSSKKTPPTITIAVRDRGMGIPADALPYIFDRFFRAEKSRNRKSGGSGLGLSIAKNIVEKLGGKISAENIPEGGTTVFITFFQEICLH